MELTAALQAELEADVIEICRDLIRIPSVNYGDGRGDEAEVSRYVQRKLQEVGISAEIFESAPNRCNVIANIPGSDRSLPGLVMNGHLDVVPASAEDWTVDPFSADVKDGCIWGRGAVDMKDMDAMMLGIFRLWARHNFQPRRSIVLAFFADEEAGGIFGSRWMVENHPEIFSRCSEAVSEVGGFSVTLRNSKRVYLIETSQKGIEWLNLTAKGVAGHGSLLNENNAVTRISKAVTEIGEYRWPQRLTRTNKKLFQKISEITGIPYNEENLQPLLDQLGPAAKMIGATLRNTANPTMLNAGYKANVIPQTASAVIDGRTVPGFEPELIVTLREIIGEDIEINPIVSDIPLEAEFEVDLVDKMKAALYAEDPEGIAVPYVLSGGTDNKALARLGIKGYGFSPLKLPSEIDFMALFHGVDERIPIESLKFGARTLYKFLIQI
jgi:acetylornithine deacetylase/succinyl-diaminopimelate desuccinylase-like protein